MINIVEINGDFIMIIRHQLFKIGMMLLNIVLKDNAYLLLLFMNLAMQMILEHINLMME